MHGYVKHGCVYCIIMQALQLGLPTTMAEVVHTVELLQEASQWFPGGSKEMRVSEGRCLPLTFSSTIVKWISLSIDHNLVPRLPLLPGNETIYESVRIISALKFLTQSTALILQLK